MLSFWKLLFNFIYQVIVQLRSPIGEGDLLQMTLRGWDWETELNPDHSELCPAPGGRELCFAQDVEWGTVTHPHSEDIE